MGLEMAIVNGNISNTTDLTGKYCLRRELYYNNFVELLVKDTVSVSGSRFLKRESIGEYNVINVDDQTELQISRCEPNILQG